MILKMQSQDQQYHLGTDLEMPVLRFQPNPTEWENGDGRVRPAVCVLISSPRDSDAAKPWEPVIDHAVFRKHCFQELRAIIKEQKLKLKEASSLAKLGEFER